MNDAAITALGSATATVAVEGAVAYPVWEARYANEDFDRTQALAHKLTDEDRAAGRTAPAYGCSKERLDEAAVIVRDANAYGDKQMRLAAERRAAAKLAHR